MGLASFNFLVSQLFFYSKCLSYLTCFLNSHDNRIEVDRKGQEKWLNCTGPYICKRCSMNSH